MLYFLRYLAEMFAFPVLKKMLAFSLSILLPWQLLLWITEE